MRCPATSLVQSNLAGAPQPRSAVQPFSRNIHSRRHVYRLPASNDDDNNAPVNWDEAWKKVQQNIPKTDSRSTTTAPRIAPRGPPRTRLEDIKRQEQLLLNLWSDERAFAVAGISVLVVLVLFVVVVGPPTC